MPTPRERLHGGLARGFVAVCRTTALSERHLDRPAPGLAAVAAGAEPDDAPNNAIVGDNFKQGRISCWLQDKVGHGSICGALAAGQGAILDYGCRINVTPSGIVELGCRRHWAFRAKGGYDPSFTRAQRAHEGKEPAAIAV
jgi:hypothetical protein